MREGWKRIRLGEVFGVSTTKLGTHSEEPAVFAISKYDGVVLSEDYHDRRVASAKLDGYKVLDADAWAYSTIHIDEGSIARNNHGFVGVVSPMYTILSWVSEDCDPAYFEYLLRTPEMLSTYRDMAQGSINRRRSLPWKSFSAIEVEIPTLEEQKRIVDLIGSLDDAIEAADTAVEAIAASTVQSRDVVFSSYASIDVGDLLVDISAGKSPSASNEPPQEGQYGVLKVSAVHESGFRAREAKTVSDHSIFSPSMSVRANDVIMTRANTAERVGLVCMAESDHPNLFLCDKTLRLVPAQDVDPACLTAALQTSSARSQLQAFGTGTSGSMKNITQDSIRSVRVHWPESIEEQMRVADLLSSFRDSKRAAENYAKALRASRSELLTVLFSGEHEIPESYDVDAAVPLETAA